MGQKKIKIIDLSQEEKPSKGKKPDGKKATLKHRTPPKAKTLKALKKKNSASSEKFSDLSVAKKVSKGRKASDEKSATLKKLKDQKALKRKKIRSKRYKELKLKFQKEKYYSPAEATSLLIQLANSKIDETVETHISTHKDKLTGTVNFPHGTGKKQKVAIATNDLIDKVKSGKIDFDILIASPHMMSKIAKVAKILGPKGLMPNPKSGTISDRPEELKKKLEKGETRFKTEPKAPLLHLTIGKISFGEEKLFENLQALIKAVEIKNIKKAVLTSTHSPGIKLSL